MKIQVYRSHGSTLLCTLLCLHSGIHSLYGHSSANKRQRMSSSASTHAPQKNPISVKKATDTTQPILSVITAQNHTAINTDLPVVLNIKADWCSTYTPMAESFKAVAHTLYKKCVCAEIEVDCFEDNDETITFLKEKFGVSIECIPTVLIIKGNKVHARVEETLDEESLKQRIISYLK